MTTKEIDAELIERVKRAAVKAANEAPAYQDIEAAKFIAMYRAIRAYDLEVAVEALNKCEQIVNDA